MAKRSEDAYFEFANRYGDPTDNFLTAYNAISRLETLIDDLTSLKDKINLSDKDSIRFYPYYEAEIISYYAVGFVTCLEWHARSRLKDLFSYNPEFSIGNSLAKIDDKIIQKAISREMSIAALLTSTFSVSSFNRYIEIFDLIISKFYENNSKPNIVKWLNSHKSPIDRKIIFNKKNNECLKDLFEFRNGLVHEIGISIVGHNNIRDVWNIEKALEVGDLILRFMRGIELLLTKSLPSDFPNILDNKAQPVNKVDVLLKNLSSVQSNFISELDTYLESEFDFGRDEINQWKEFVIKSNDLLTEVLSMVDMSIMYHNRYVDYKEPIKYSLIFHHIAMFKKLVNLI